VVQNKRYFSLNDCEGNVMRVTQRQTAMGQQITS